MFWWLQHLLNCKFQIHFYTEEFLPLDQVKNTVRLRNFSLNWTLRKYTVAFGEVDANCFYAFILPNEILTKKVEACLAQAAVWEGQPSDGNARFTQRIHKVFLYLLYNSSSTHLHLNERLVISNLGKNSLNTYIHF